MTLPSILLVHGAWHVVDYLQDLKTSLESRGHKVYLPQLPSTGGGPHILLQDDVRVVRDILEAALAAGEEIVIAAHSYGGVVATEAVLAEYSKKYRSMTGARGGVLHAIYISAFLLMPGQSLIQCLMGTTGWGSTPPWKPVTVGSAGLNRHESGMLMAVARPHDPDERSPGEVLSQPLRRGGEQVGRQAQETTRGRAISTDTQPRLPLPRHDLRVRRAGQGASHPAAKMDGQSGASNRGAGGPSGSGEQRYADLGLASQLS